MRSSATLAPNRLGKPARISVRVPVDANTVLSEAATMSGLTLSRFVLETGYEAACKVVAAHDKATNSSPLKKQP